MQVRKQEIATEIRRQLAALGAASQPAMVRLLSDKGLKISQPTLSRVLNGNYEATPDSLIDICKYSSISLNKYLVDTNPADSDKLMGALRTAWDGSPEREVFLARVIKAAAKLGRVKLQRTKSA